MKRLQKYQQAVLPKDSIMMKDFFKVEKGNTDINTNPLLQSPRNCLLHHVYFLEEIRRGIFINFLPLWNITYDVDTDQKTVTKTA